MKENTHPVFVKGVRVAATRPLTEKRDTCIKRKHDYNLISVE